MQPALVFREPGPAPRASIFPGPDRTRAMRATNARVIAVVQRIVRNLVLADVRPHHFRCPIGNRVNLDPLKLGVPLYFSAAARDDV